jgi:hypothetical protein
MSPAAGSSNEFGIRAFASPSAFARTRLAVPPSLRFVGRAVYDVGVDRRAVGVAEQQSVSRTSKHSASPLRRNGAASRSLPSGSWGVVGRRSRCWIGPVAVDHARRRDDLVAAVDHVVVVEDQRQSCAGSRRTAYSRTGSLDVGSSRTAGTKAQERA